MEYPLIRTAPRSRPEHTLPARRGHEPGMLVDRSPTQHHRQSHPPPRAPATSSGSSPTAARGARSAGPMSIPNAKEPVPPALPPPKRIDGLEEGAGSAVDLGWWLGNRSRDRGDGDLPATAVDPASSLRGGSAGPGEAEPGHDMDLDALPARRPDRRTSSNATIKAFSADDARICAGPRPLDEGYASLSPSTLAAQKLPGEESQSHAFLQRSVQAYDNSLLQKIDSARSGPAPSRAGSTSARNYQPPLFRPSMTSPVGDPMREVRRLPQQLKPLAVSLSQTSAGNSPPRSWVESPDSLSPRQPATDGLPVGYMEYRNSRRETGSLSAITPDRERALPGLTAEARRAGSMSMLGGGGGEDRSTFAQRAARDGYDGVMHGEPLEADFHMEETGLRHLHLGDRSPPSREDLSPQSRAGQKRRASSPPRDPDGQLVVGPASAAGEFGQRPQLCHRSAERKSSVPRLNHGSGSVSSTTSLPRSASLVSSAGVSLAASSTTSMSSYDRVSPRGTSPVSEADPGPELGHGGSAGHRPSPRNSLSRGHPRGPVEIKTAPSSRRASTDEPGHGSSTHPGKFYICECCPKKPKKFDSLADLRTHEMEKQYTCQYCHNRFKNKNEAERHQNSLHLRRHSWSCNALSGVEAAFHASPRKSATVDVCGYCGKDFPTPANWDARVEHLTMVHKFGECNQAKKFFRADHFRQHLKHSHAGTSGKWTNMLENACMKDEPLPERLGGVNEGVGRIDEEREEA